MRFIKGYCSRRGRSRRSTSRSCRPTAWSWFSTRLPIRITFGAILRTAAAFAVDALVTTERHSPEFAGALAKSASGGLEHVPICSVPNLARALAELGDMGYWRIGLDSEAELRLTDETLTRPLALVLGAEDRGLRRLTRERCDRMARLDLPGAIKSLNVSNACAIALALVHERLSAEA